MRRLLLAILVGAAPTAAHAASQDFTVINRTGFRIDSIYVGEAGGGQWGNDVMGRSALYAGERVDISFERATQTCRWDLLVKYHDASQAVWTGLDFCTISAVSLFWDPRTQITTARTQ